ncbi:DUF1330 domain-containing protein [Marinobacterium arenosum]|uniref:DUF1330 domain-containing protein n=1 Tax=Marinobacterium arenosum TaxID=2862496 RepID=UPI0021030B8C|nr:DUF1330 domain-containing protein [Marinobacterium arenosum]
MYEMLVGLEVSDREVYTKYREAMKPILVNYGGGFGFDFVVSEVLLSQVDEPINRVFTITFPSQSAMDSFFADAEYQQVKEQYFVHSVRNTTIIASYEKNA